MLSIIFTIIGAFLQTFRNLEQKALSKKLDTLTVSWSRFILPLPLAILTVFLTFSSVGSQFFIYCLITAVFQISGNFLLIETFRSKNFSIGVAFYKTEVLQTLILGLLFFNQSISNLGFFLIILTSFGVFLMSNLSLKIKNFNFSQKAVLFGLLSGFCFSISAFNLKFASESLYGLGYSKFLAPAIVLLWVILLQNIIFILVKSYQKRLKSDLKKLLSSENRASFIKTSLLSFVGSLFWFIAFALGNVIYVKAVGQIEMVFAVLASHFYLREKHSKREFIGIAVTTIGILSLIFLSNIHV
jgi:drug/metabolite transporter (DMT)-like permease